MIANRIETLGERVARLRRDRKIPQYRLANDIGLHPSSLNQIEKGKRKPQAETISALARVLDVSHDYIMHGKEHGAGTADHAPQDRPQTIDVSAIDQAVRSSIREMLADIINAVSVAIATSDVSAPAERENQRSEAKSRRTGSH